MPKILIIDDDPALGRAVGSMPKNIGFEVVGALDGRTGVKLYSETKFDLVITDMLMPNFDGIELIITLHKLDPQVAIIAMSGGGIMSGENLLQIAKALGAKSVLAKPFAMPDLIKLIAQELNLPALVPTEAA